MSDDTVFTYRLEGQIFAPAGTTISDTGSSLTLPDGRVIKLWEQLELTSSADAGDERNLSFFEAMELGLHYDGEMCRFEEADMPPEPVEGPAVTLIFRPQAWVNDYAIPVDPETPDTWEIPRTEFLQEFPIEEKFREDHYARDDLRTHRNAPKWVRDWSGPFEVDIACNEPWKGDSR